MTHTNADATAPDESGKAAGSQSRRRNLIRWGVGALVLLLAVLGLAYAKVTDDAADQVLLRWRQSPPECGDAKIRPANDDPGGLLTPAAVVVTDDFRCTIVVEVLNRSDHSIHLDHAVARGVGPETGSVVRIDPTLHPQRGHRDDLGPDGYGFDAYVEISSPDGLDLDAGQSTTFAVDLVFNPEGCVNGATTWMDAWPDISFSVMGRNFTRAAANSLAFFHRGTTPGCKGY